MVKVRRTESRKGLTPATTDLEGGTRRQITEKLSNRFNTSIRTSDNDYTAAMKLLKEEQIATRSDLLNQLQALRLAGARKALAKGQLQTSASC